MSTSAPDSSTSDLLTALGIGGGQVQGSLQPPKPDPVSGKAASRGSRKVETALEPSKRWAAYSPELAKQIRQAPWKLVDVETTGLSPQSAPVVTQTHRNSLRCRVLTVRFPDESHPEGMRTVAFDLDHFRQWHKDEKGAWQHTDGPQVAELANAALTGTFIAHNAGFDLGWLRHTGGYAQAPERVLDTLLLARGLVPHIPLIQDSLLEPYADLINQRASQKRKSGFTQEDEDGGPGYVAPLHSGKDYIDYIYAKMFHVTDDSKVSRWGLGDLAPTLLGTLMSKDLQKASNWVVEHLGDAHYDYATTDVDDLEKIVRILLRMDAPATQQARALLPALPDPALGHTDSRDILGRYLALKESSLAVMPWEEGRPQALTMKHILGMLEPQVMDVVHMRETGMPWDRQHVENYIQGRGVRDKAVELAHLAEVNGNFPLQEPEMLSALQNPKAGISAQLKEHIGAAFSWLGLPVQRTAKTGAYMVGEPELRKQGALGYSPQTRALFDAWTCLNRAKKTLGMAESFSTFATPDSPRDWRIHPQTGHGPITGRLRSGEPNCQQIPSDTAFRDSVRAPDGYVICASDFSALDMRVGAALAVRAQQRIRQVYEGKRHLTGSPGRDQEILPGIHRVLDLAPKAAYAPGEQQTTSLRALDEHLTRTQQRVARLKEQMRGWYDISAPRYQASRQSRPELYEKWQDALAQLKHQHRLARFEMLLTRVTRNAVEAGTPEWSSLRNAFCIPGMDIHTWTTLSMRDKDPNVLYQGMSNEQVVSELKKAKKEVGDDRKSGKVCNLSLTYGMTAGGLQDTAARRYNIHWTQEQAQKEHSSWLKAFPEIELWHLWTDLCVEMHTMRSGKDGRCQYVPLYSSDTLGNRRVFATSLNAALSYEDQSSGADILGRVLQTLHAEHPEVFKCVINQIHDELLCQFPADKAQEYERILGQVMTDCANAYTMPYGVPCEATPATGFTWLKDPAFDNATLKQLNVLRKEQNLPALDNAALVGELALKGLDMAREAHEVCLSLMKGDLPPEEAASRLHILCLSEGNPQPVPAPFKGELPVGTPPQENPVPLLPQTLAAASPWLLPAAVPPGEQEPGRQPQAAPAPGKTTLEKPSALDEAVDQTLAAVHQMPPDAQDELARQLHLLQRRNTKDLLHKVNYEALRTDLPGSGAGYRPG